MLLLFLKELKNFVKKNYWVIVLFLICLWLIWYTNSGNLLWIIFIFVLHFIADIFMMIMQDYYVINNEKYALYAQTISFAIFSFIGLYEGVFYNKWVYSVPQLLFVWPLIKWYFGLKNVNFLFYISWGIAIFIYLYFWLINNFWDLVQLFGFILFPLWLIQSNEKLRYFLSLVWIFFISLGSFYQLYMWIISHNVSGADVSFFLLPLVVLVYFMKDIKKYV